MSETLEPGGRDGSSSNDGRAPDPVAKTNSFAITSLVSSVVFAPLGIVFGHLALRQIRRTREHGRGLAIGGLAIGYFLTVVGVVALIATTVLVSSAVDNGSVDADSSSQAAGQEPSRTGDDGVDYSKVDPETLTVDQFYDDTIYPESYRIKWAGQVIDQRTAMAVPEINRLLALDNRDSLPVYDSPSLTNIAQDILTQQTVAEYIASTAPTPDQGRKLLASEIASSNREDRPMAMRKIGSGRKPLLAT